MFDRAKLSLNKTLDQISEESKQWRDEAAREHGLLEQSKASAANLDKERAALLGNLRRSDEVLKEAQQNILALEAQIAELIASRKIQDGRLAESLSLSGLSVHAASVLKAVRDHLTQGYVQFVCDGLGEAAIVITDLDGRKLEARKPCLLDGAFI